MTHSSLAGGVSFNTTNGLYLDAQQYSTPFSGTGFVINYNFVAGYSYGISVTAKGDQFMYLNTSVVQNLNAFQTASQTSCNLDPNVPNWNRTGYGQLNTAVTGTSTTYNIPTFSISSGMPIYLVVWATGGNPSYSVDNLNISQIVITKTAIAPSFNITPATLSLTCGTTSPETFTVNNPAGVTGITNYAWNLGATPNGWNLPNGTAAPATYSTGTTNTLTLTPVCGSVQKNVSATVTANGNNYNTNTSAVTITPATLTITDNKSLCSGSANYSVSNVPCGATVTWSVSPSGIANLSCTTCNQTTLTAVSNGSVTLSATVANGCGSGSELISVGVPAAPTSISAVTSIEDIDMLVDGGIMPSNVTSYNWYNNNVLVPNQHTSECDILVTCNVNYLIAVQAVNACGVSLKYSKLEKAPCGGGYTISPNPSSGIVTVSSTSTNPSQNKTESTTISQNKIYQLKVLDQAGNVLKVFTYSGGISTTQVDLSSLSNGTYILQIYNNVNWTSQQIVILR